MSGVRIGYRIVFVEETMKNLRIFAVVLAIAPLAAGAGLTACGHTNEAGGEVVPASAVGLDVKNQNFLDVDVFSIVDGLSTRLGTVTGNSSRHFLLDPMVGSRDFHLIAVPIGGSGRASSGNVVVSPGQTIVFTVGSVLANSNVFVR
jgi:hypothetical protein